MRWFTLTMALSLSLATSAHAQIEQVAATEAYRLGDDAFNRGDYKAALESYQRSLALLSSPNTRLLVARTLARLERWSEALGQYQTTIAEAADRTERDPRFAKTHEVAEQEAAEARAHVAFIRVDASKLSPETVVKVDGHALPVASWDLEIPHDPGALHVTFEAPGREPMTVDETLVAHGVMVLPPRPLANVTSTRETLTPVAPSSSHGGLRVIGWSVLAIGGASLVASGVFAGVTQNEYDAVKMRCGDGCTSADVSTGRALAATTYVTLGVGIGLAVIGFVVVLASPKSAPKLALSAQGWTF